MITYWEMGSTTEGQGIEFEDLPATARINGESLATVG